MRPQKIHELNPPLPSIKTPGGSIFCRATTTISFQIDPVYQNSQQKISCYRHRTITLLLRGRWRCQIVTFEGRKQIAQGEELVSTPVGSLWSDHAPGPSPRRLQWISTTATGKTGHSSWRAMMRLKGTKAPERHPKYLLRSGMEIHGFSTPRAVCSSNNGASSFTLNLSTNTRAS